MKNYEEKYPIWIDGLPKASLDHARDKYKRQDCRFPIPVTRLFTILSMESHELGVARLAESVAQRVKDIGLWDKFAFVSLESVHVTTFDLVNKSEYERKVGGHFIYEDASLEFCTFWNR